MSLRSDLEPFVEFDGHRRKKMALVYSIRQVFAESAAAGISRWPDPDSRHDSADSVDDLRRNALGFFRTRPGLFEAGVKLLQELFWRSLHFTAARAWRAADPPELVSRLPYLESWQKAVSGGAKGTF